MVTGWRRAFCTSIPKDRDPKPPSSSSIITDQQCDKSPKISSKFGFFSSSSSSSSSNSNPSTPKLQSLPVDTPAGLRCRTTPSLPNSPKLQCHVSTSRACNSVPSSPKSPSTFSLLKLRVLSKTRCGICVQSVKSGQGTAIFTAECSHSFHFPCIAAHVKGRTGAGYGQVLTCPVCSAAWKELPLLSLHHHHNQNPNRHSQSSTLTVKTLRVYDDDEPLMSPTAGAGFVPIPEEGDDDESSVGEEFRGFFVSRTPRFDGDWKARGVEIRLLPEAAIVAAGRGYETYAVVMKVTAAMATITGPSRRAPVDLVAVVDVGSAIAGIQTAKRAMRLILSSLGSSDRLSIVAFSSLSKRLLPLRRMSGAGKRSARRIADALGAVAAAEKGISVSDAVKKAAKILEDRREKNPLATIVLLSDTSGNQIYSSSVGNFPVHFVGLAGANSDDISRRVASLLRPTARELHLRLSVGACSSSPAEIAAVYSLSKRPSIANPSLIRIGDIHAEEEREFLVEIRVPTCASKSNSSHVLSVRSSHTDPSSSEIINSGEQSMLVPRPQTVRSSASIERLRNLHLATRAVAESRRLAEQEDLNGARRLISSARALLGQSRSASAEEFSRGLEAELGELSRLRIAQRSCEEKTEQLTPTSAWRAAERLAKVAIMRKSMNRVSDLHGFENARF